MKTVNIYKAQVIGDQQIESIQINVWRFGDECGDWLERSNQTFAEEADKLVDALHSLPGGTLDRVLVMLLEEKVSQHIVPWEKHNG